jgi:hypothetical protein
LIRYDLAAQTDSFSGMTRKSIYSMLAGPVGDIAAYGAGVRACCGYAARLDASLAYRLAVRTLIHIVLGAQRGLRAHAPY